MRLICPNCGAQYEVDDAVIPDQGRDVQCSNCGHTWFQQPAHKDHETAEERALEADMDLASGEDDGEADEPADAPSRMEGGPKRQDLDPDVAQLLREEAEREAAARKAEARGGLETQPDLGLDEAAEAAAARSAAARARMARLRGGSDAEPGAEAIPPGARKELLPDVEEITSSLRPSGERAADPAAGSFEQVDDGLIEGEARSRNSGRLIFRLIVIGAVLALAVYVFAPQIVAQVPQAEPYLSQYVGAVNGLRAQIDPIVAGVVEQIQGLLGAGGEEAAPPPPAPPASDSVPAGQ